VDANGEKSIDKSQGNSFPPNKNVRSNISSSQGSSSFNSRIKCHTCHGFGHMSFQCPSKTLSMLEKDSPKRSQEVIKESAQAEVEEDICEPLE
jgi:hypothetical protein